MTEVFFDDEAVVFDGGAPKTIGDLLTLCHGSAEARRCVVVEVLCDGAPCAESDAGRELAAIGRVDVRTIPIRDALRAVAAECASTLDAAASRLAELDREVLRSPWSVVRDRCIALAQEFGGALEQCAVLDGPEETRAWRDELRDSMARVAEALEAWIERIATGDAPGLCVQGEMKLAPQLAEFARALARAAGGLA